MKRIICWLFGHVDHAGFWETSCCRCGRVKQDRLYQRGYGIDPRKFDL